jgi:hypothetical protein
MKKYILGSFEMSMQKEKSLYSSPLVNSSKRALGYSCK